MSLMVVFYDDLVQGFGRMDQNLSCMTHTIPYSIWLFTYRQLQLYIWTYRCISVSSSVSTCQFASFKVGGWSWRCVLGVDFCHSGSILKPVFPSSKKHKLSCTKETPWSISSVSRDDVYFKANSWNMKTTGALNLHLNGCVGILFECYCRIAEQNCDCKSVFP